MKHEIRQFCDQHRITEDQFYGRQPIDGDLYLGSVTALPKGFNPTVGGDLYLRSVTALPEGFNPTVGGYLYLRSVTALPEGFNATVGGYLDLRSVTALPKGFNPAVGGYLDLGSVTNLPKGFIPNCSEYYYQGQWRSTGRKNGWTDGKYIIADNILTEIISKRGNVYKVKHIGKTEITYLVTDGENWAHGNSLKDAKQSLREKVMLNPERWKSTKISDELNFEDAIACYRAITGACRMGVQMFLEETGAKKKPYTPEQIIAVTKGRYGHEQFKSFFK